MKLVRLYSDTNLINEITFKNGLNIIFGKYSTEGKDINGIGKTTIINFIDYCLLADGPKQNYKLEKFSFLKDHSITLDIEVKNERISLKRKFDKLNVVYIKKDGNAEAEYLDTEYRSVIGKLILNENEYKGIVDPDWYRTIMSFFIQNDHNFLKRDAKDVINFINIGLRKSELISFMYFLIGFDNRYIYEYDMLQVKQKIIQADHSRVEKNIINKTEKSVKQFKAEIDEYESKIKLLEAKAKEYEFFETNRIISIDLERIQKEISSLQEQYFDLENKLNDIRKSISYDLEVDTDRVEKLYNELNREFSSFLVHSISEVQEFRKRIAQNRRRFLIEREQEYSIKLDQIKQRIGELEPQKRAIYEKIKHEEILDDIKKTYSYLSDLKVKNEQNRILSEELDKVERDSAYNKFQISNTINMMVSQKPELDEVMSNLKAIFFDLISNTVEIDENEIPPYINIEPRANIKSPVDIDIHVPRSGSLGKDRFEILVFDMTVFISTLNDERSLPKFLIHDGVFHGIAHKTRIKYLNYIKSGQFKSEVQMISC